jgi:uncharacterized protein (TIGR02246 family)
LTLVGASGIVKIHFGGFSMRRSRLTSFALAAIAGVVIFQGCSDTKPDPAKLAAARAADEASIRAASAAWSAASQSKDLDKAVAVYSDDAVGFTDGGPIATTRADLRAVWQQVFAAPDSSLTWKTTAVHVAQSGDIAYEYGAYSLATNDKQGRITTQPGKYVLVWKKQADGSWKVAIDIDNKDALPAVPHAAPRHAGKKHSRGRASRHR